MMDFLLDFIDEARKLPLIWWVILIATPIGLAWLAQWLISVAPPVN